MKTSHKIIFANSNNMKDITSESVDLVITSPPYPIIELWVNLFSKINPKIKQALNVQNGSLAFELMHQELDKVWKEVYRVIRRGGIVCINIGDAVQTIARNFQLYTNHSRIISACLDLGFSCLPGIIWRKPTNAPNKFMGSGMLPPGAYVTLEHEFILILRKGRKREFKSDNEKRLRRESAFFWEERNNWFSDLWAIKGISQTLDVGTRTRSAAFPYELAFRLINMFSIKKDVILDPFLGTGTTTIAAMSSGRNSIGYELDTDFKELIKNRIGGIVEFSNQYIDARLEKHRNFVKERMVQGKPLKYINNVYNFQVITKQEQHLFFNRLRELKQQGSNLFEVTYENNT